MNQLNDVNLIPREEAVAYLKMNIPRDAHELGQTRCLIDLLELGLLEAGYQEGHVAYRVRGDPYSAFVTLLLTHPVDEVKAMLPELKNIKEEYREKFKTPVRRGSVSGPLMDLLETVRGLPASEVTSLHNYLLKECQEQGYVDQELARRLSEYFILLSVNKDGDAGEEASRVLEEIRLQALEEEKKLVEAQENVYKFLELFEKVKNAHVKEVKTILSDLRENLMNT